MALINFSSTVVLNFGCMIESSGKLLKILISRPAQSESQDYIGAICKHLPGTANTEN